MATKTFKVALSLDNPRIIQSGIDVRSFDKQSIKIAIELTKNSQTYQIPTGAQIKISLLKIARQEQKIILDIPNANRDVIEWVVTDHLDGYHGVVRVGVYLIVGDENIDVGYFNITSNVSDIDKAAEEFTDSVMQGWDQIEADLAEIRATITQVNTLSSDFTADVAMKKADVTSKYNEFDTSVTQAGQMIDDILALQPQFQSVLDETTGKDVISAPEIILARGGASTLGERLDEEKAEVSAQLQQNTEDISKVEKETIYNRKSNSVGPMVSFQSDDGPIQDYTIVFPYAKQKNVPFTLGIINNSPLPVERILELQNEHGWDVHSHTVTHPRLSQISPEQLDHEMKVSKEYLQSIGVKVDSIMYPYGDSSKEVLDAARKYYRAGFGSEQGINRSPIDTYSIKRVSLDSNTVERCKQYVDEIGNDGWIVFYTHPATMVPGQRYAFMDLIDYVQEKQIPIVTCGEALNSFENRLSIGNKAYDGEYAFIGADGKHDFSSLPIVYKKSIAAVNAKRPVDFEVNKVTMNTFKTGTASDIPFDSGIGTLITNRMNYVNGQFVFDTQTFYGYRGAVAQRQGKNADTWEAWTNTSNFNTTRNNYTNASLLTEFPVGKVTTTHVLSGDNAGFPAVAGVLITSALINNTTAYQLFHPLNRGVFFKRNWTGSAWAEWVMFSPSFARRFDSLNFGTIPANGSATVEVKIDGVTINDAVSASPRAGIVGGLIINAHVPWAGAVNIRVFNVTAAPITLTRDFVVSVIKV